MAEPIAGTDWTSVLAQAAKSMQSTLPPVWNSEGYAATPITPQSVTLQTPGATGSSAAAPDSADNSWLSGGSWTAGSPWYDEKRSAPTTAYPRSPMKYAPPGVQINSEFQIPYLNPAFSHNPDAYDDSRTRQIVANALGGAPLTYENFMRTMYQQAAGPLVNPVENWTMRGAPIPGLTGDPNATPQGLSPEDREWQRIKLYLSQLQRNLHPNLQGPSMERSKMAMTPLAQSYFASRPVQLPQYAGGGDRAYWDRVRSGNSVGYTPLTVASSGSDRIPNPPGWQPGPRMDLHSIVNAAREAQGLPPMG